MGRQRPVPGQRVLRSRAAWHHRIRLGRAALRYWAATILVAAALASLVGRAAQRAERAEAAWGRTRTVLVADGSIDRGAPLAGRVRARRWPIGVAPPGALRSLPRGAVAAEDVDRGSAITPAMVRRRTDPSADGRRTMAVTVPPASLPVEVGDEVDVWVSVDASLAGEVAPTTRRTATAARVVAFGDRWVVLSVRPADVRALAAAAGTATVTLVGTA